MSVVVEMTFGTTTWAWLCDPCATARVAAGWTVKRKQAIAWGCDDCERNATAESSRTVDYAPTSPGSFCPPPGWTAPKMPETWPARLDRLKREARK